MGFLKNIFFKDKNPTNTEKAHEEIQTKNVQVKPKAIYEDEYTRLGLIKEITNEEKEFVSVIASSIFAGDNNHTKIKIESVRAIDEDKINAIAAVSALAARDYPDSNFRLVSIREIIK